MGGLSLILSVVYRWGRKGETGGEGREGPGSLLKDEERGDPFPRSRVASSPTVSRLTHW